MTDLKRNLCAALLCLLLIAAFLCGCGSPAAENPGAASEPTPEPTAEQPSEIRLGSLTVSPDVEELDLTGTGTTVEELLNACDRMTSLKTLCLGVREENLAQLRAIEAAFPNTAVTWKVIVLGREVLSSAEELDLSEASDEDIPAVISALAVLPEVRTLTLAAEDGVTTLSYDSLSALAAAVPEAELNCRFELYGQTADWTTEKLKYKKTAIGNDGIDDFRAALPYLRSLTLLRFENCGIDDYDKMDALRSDFPDKGVVWSINISGYTFMTDTTLINDGDSNLLNDYNVGLLRYMHDVLYLDIGHNHHLTNIDFVRNFPKLQVFVLTLCDFNGDISALENCPDLEFFECHGTAIGDISVLADKTKLEYLNIANLKNLTDLSPLYGLDQLKIVRICGSSFTHITQADIAALREHLPATTNVSDYGGDPNSSGQWRYTVNGDKSKPTERYALLREQMRYDLNWQQRLSNSPSGEED